MSFNAFVVDTETGGLNPAEADILTIGIVPIVDGAIQEGREWKIKGKRVQAKAMEVNKINLDEHNKVAQGRNEVRSEIEEYIKEIMGDKQYVTVGHNLGFDLKFIEQLSPKLLDYFNQRNSLDTKQLATFFKAAGFFDEKQSTSLGNIVGVLNIPEGGTAHTALADATTTGRLLIFFLNKLTEMAGAFLDMVAIRQEMQGLMGNVSGEPIQS